MIIAAQNHTARHAMESAGRSKRDELAAGVGHGAQNRGIRRPSQSESATKLVGKQRQNGCPVPLPLLPLLRKQ